jgi:lipopolysaccharide transport system permease protein
MLYSDIAKIISLGLRLLMYITPVVYAIPKDGILKRIMELNPFTPLILTARNFVTGTTPEYIAYFIGIIIVCIPLFFLGMLFYRISIPILVERMSA